MKNAGCAKSKICEWAFSPLFTDVKRSPHVNADSSVLIHTLGSDSSVLEMNSFKHINYLLCFLLCLVVRNLGSHETKGRQIDCLVQNCFTGS